MSSASGRSGAAAFGRRGAAKGALVCAAVLLFGCGKSPYIYRPYPPMAPPPPEATREVPATQGTTIYIILPPEGEAEPAPVVAVQQEGWIPDALPATNPFERTRTWIGDYDCVQGNTDLTLRIVDVRGRVLRAVFDFRHVPSGAAGSYLISGTFDPETRLVRFEPGRWIVKPDDYLMVSMEGEVAMDGSLFAGKITHAGCGAFRLSPTR